MTPWPALVSNFLATLALRCPVHLISTCPRLAGPQGATPGGDRPRVMLGRCQAKSLSWAGGCFCTSAVVPGGDCPSTCLSLWQVLPASHTPASGSPRLSFSRFLHVLCWTNQITGHRERRSLQT